MHRWRGGSSTKAAGGLFARSADYLDRLADERGDGALAVPTDVTDPEAVEGVTSLVRDAVTTNTNHTTEIDPSDVTTLDDATHRVMEDRPEAYRDELCGFLCPGASD